jgi:hypothetical protein
LGESVLGQDDGKPAHEQIAAEHRSLDALFGDTRNVLKEADAGGEVRRRASTTRPSGPCART